MEQWRSRETELLPELAALIVHAEEPLDAWREISAPFQDAYTEPRSEELIRHIYQFACWCLKHGERDPAAGRDLPTCMVVGFLESIPNHSASREYMPRWFTGQELLAMQKTFTHLYNGDFPGLLTLRDEHEPSRRAMRSEAERYRQYWGRQEFGLTVAVADGVTADDGFTQVRHATVSAAPGRREAAWPESS